MHVWIIAEISRSVPGGMRRHMELHAEGLRRLGHEATLLFTEDLPPAMLHELTRRIPGTSSLGSLLARYRDERPDLINVHTLAAPPWIAARRAGVIESAIVVMSYAADEPGIDIARSRDVLRWARVALPARAAFKRADGIWCVNQQDAEYYVRAYGVERSRIGRFPHAVADAFYEEDGDVERNPRQLLFVGTWIERKGNDVLRQALPEVVARTPEVEIVLAGTLTGEARVRESLPAEVARRTRILDRASDAELRALYRASAMLLMPSRREGLPISMLEGMACGCPCLAAANSGMLDTIEPGRNGWLEVSFDPARWADRITRLLADSSGLAEASRAARRTADDFRVTRVATDVVAWYSRLLGQGTQGSRLAG